MVFLQSLGGVSLKAGGVHIVVTLINRRLIINYILKFNYFVTSVVVNFYSCIIMMNQINV